MARGKGINSRTGMTREEAFAFVASHLVRTRGGPIAGGHVAFHLPEGIIRKINKLNLGKRITTRQPLEPDRVTGRLASTRNSNSIPVGGGLFEPSIRNEEIMRRKRR
ncbi:MAG: hypothetical protein AABX01_03340 [Candidatus Micrarchaeota archaeon]